MTKPKILFIDIETAPNLSYVWGCWETNVIAHKREWYLLSVAWKWEGQKTECLTIADFDSKNDKELSKHIHKLFQEADVIVAHNGNSFDIKKCKARFLFWGLPPTKRLTTIDTKLIAKSQFSFNSNSLDDLGRHLGLGRKTKTPGFDLWLGCMAGNKKSWALLSKYNKNDVDLLHRLYNKMRGWIPNHPSLAKLQDRVGCPTCGSPSVRKRGLRATHASLQQSWACNDCGGWYLTRVTK